MEQTNQNIETDKKIDKPVEKKQNKGLMIGMIACAVLGVGGLGFGIYEMMQTNDLNQKIKKLETELRNEKARSSYYKGEIEEYSDSSTPTTETEQTNTNETAKTIKNTDVVELNNGEEYIKLTNWGVKIKLPSTLKNVSYVYRGEYGGNAGLYIAARPSNDTSEVSGSDDFANMSYYDGLAAISLVKDPTKCGGNAASPYRDCRFKIVNSDGKEIGIDFSLSGAFNSSSDSGQREIEEQTHILINNWLIDASNYSAI